MSGGVVTLTWSGDVDLSAAAELDVEVASVLDAGKLDRLIIDMAAVEFLDSSGIGVLVDARNRCVDLNADIVLRSMSVSVKRVLHITGLDGIFIYEDPHPTEQLSGETLPWTASMPAVPDPKFDRFAALCARVIGVPTALVTLVDREKQVFPGAVGLPAPWQGQRSTPLSHSFCQYVVDRGAALVVPDATADPLLVENLAVPDLKVVAYAGMPLIDLDGRAVGSLCAIDVVARDWTEHELQNLRDLADICSSEIQLRTARRRLAHIVAQSAGSRRRRGAQSILIVTLVPCHREGLTSKLLE